MKSVTTCLAVTMLSTAAMMAMAQPTLRENDLVMTLEAEITNAAFEFDGGSFEISAGQPRGLPPVVSSFTRSNRQLNFRVYAGRSATRPVADRFNEATRRRVATRRDEATGGPEDLNFTFRGRLTLNDDQFSNFNIGQGSKRVGVSSFNNWWVGTSSGTTAVKDGAAFLCLDGSRERYQIKLPGDESDRMEITVLGDRVCGS